MKPVYLLLLLALSMPGLFARGQTPVAFSPTTTAHIPTPGNQIFVYPKFEKTVNIVSYLVPTHWAFSPRVILLRELRQPYALEIFKNVFI